MKYLDYCRLYHSSKAWQEEEQWGSVAEPARSLRLCPGLAMRRLRSRQTDPRQQTQRSWGVREKGGGGDVSANHALHGYATP